MKTNRYLKVLGIFLGLFIVAPLVVQYFLWDSGSEIVGGISLYILLVAPLLFIAAYFIAQCKTAKEKILFITFGFVIPFGIIYYFVYLDYLKNFQPGKFS